MLQVRPPARVARSVCIYNMECLAVLGYTSSVWVDEDGSVHGTVLLPRMAAAATTGLSKLGQRDKGLSQIINGIAAAVTAHLSPRHCKMPMAQRLTSPVDALAAEAIAGVDCTWVYQLHPAYPQTLTVCLLPGWHLPQLSLPLRNSGRILTESR